MPMSVVYATVNGRMVQENRGGTITKYVADTLGSVIQTRNASGVQTSSITYWPYGEVRTSTGTNPSPWGFVGTLGYFRDALNRLYIRARYYIASIVMWNTVDPLWPRQPAYDYASSMPTQKVDPSGLLPFWIVAILIALIGGSCAWCAIKTLEALIDIDLGAWDKRKHCVMACMLRMTCGPICSGVFVIGTEIIDVICKLLGGDCHPTFDDVAANLAGFVCGTPQMITSWIPWWFTSPRPWCEWCCAQLNYGGKGPGNGPH